MRPLPLILFFVPAALVALLGWRLSGESARPVASPNPVVKQSLPLQKHQPTALPIALPAFAPLPEQSNPEVEAGELQPQFSALKVATNAIDCRALAQTIVELGTEDAAEAIWQAAVAQKDPVLRAAILEGLDSVVAPEMITFTASVLKATTDPEILSAATQLVTRGADMDTVGFLTELYTEEGTTEFQQRQIVHAVSTIRTEQAASALGALVQHLDTPRLAEAAAVSLFTLGTPETMNQLTDARAELAASGNPEAERVLQAIEQMMQVPNATNPVQTAQAVSR